MNYDVHRAPDGRRTIGRVRQRGQAVLMDPPLNKGSAFDPSERAAFGLEGPLPHQSTTRAEQVARAADGSPQR